MDLVKDAQRQQSDHQADLLAFEEQRLPYSAQHTVLLTVQGLLEEACFEFAQRYMPTVLQSAGYDCPMQSSSHSRPQFSQSTASNSGKRRPRA